MALRSSGTDAQFLRNMQYCSSVMAIFPFFREISFAAFLISGILGSVNYYKSGNLDLKTAGVLSAGSFVGALAGAPGRTWHRCLYRKQKCNENQPDAAETDRGCGFDCDRVHQTLSLIENGASHSRYFSLQIKSQY